uniref:DUF4371 domain-containing protein n=1 Tax=Sinocyclocheilus anshuiensis TaxID=1608454 RepID=A0A671L8P3_9TELE
SKNDMTYLVSFNLNLDLSISIYLLLYTHATGNHRREMKEPKVADPCPRGIWGYFRGYVRESCDKMDRWLLKLLRQKKNMLKKQTNKPEPQKYHQFRDEYIGMGFTSTSHNLPSALCFLCCELLANSAMKPSHLQRHLRTKHPHHVGNSLEFFRRKCHEFTSCQENMVKATSASAKAHKAMYAVCLLLAKAKKPFSLAEELIIPAAAVLAETMVGKTAADKIKTVPLSIDTVSCRIDKMGTDIVEQLVDKLRAGESFSLQLDESVDVSGQAQLVAYVRYVDTKHEITASMTGRIKGLIAHISQKNPDIQWTHCVIHREALASKKISPELNSILNDAVKAINFIKSQPLNARLFLRLYYGMGSEHTELLLHTEVRWLLRSKVLNRLFELRNEVCCFLSDNVSPLATLFKDNNWIAKLAYLADIFTKLNELNLSLQGRDITILKLYDRVGGSLSILHLYCVLALSSKVDRSRCIKTFMDGHLANQLDWVRNPFTLSQSNRGTLPVHLREELLDLSTDRGLQTTFENCSLTEFWVCLRREHPELGKRALEHLPPFGSTYLCETSFLAMTQIKTKQRNRLCLENSLITAVASLPPRMSKILREGQAHVSH